MIVPRYQQRTIYEGIYRSLIPDQKQLLWEKWMLKVDALLDDDELIEMVHAALGRRRPKSQTRGRRGTPSEVVLRLIVLKHMKNWSYETLEREVRANLLYRDFTRIGGEAVPDAKTMVRLGQALGPEVTRKIQERVVQLAREEKVTTGRKMRVDTTVVETDILCTPVHKFDIVQSLPYNRIFLFQALDNPGDRSLDWLHFLSWVGKACLLPTAYGLLPSASCLPPPGFVGRSIRRRWFCNSLARSLSDSASARCASRDWPCLL